VRMLLPVYMKICKEFGTATERERVPVSRRRLQYSQRAAAGELPLRRLYWRDTAIFVPPTAVRGGSVAYVAAKSIRGAVLLRNGRPRVTDKRRCHRR